MNVERLLKMKRLLFAQGTAYEKRMRDLPFQNMRPIRILIHTPTCSLLPSQALHTSNTALKGLVRSRYSGIRVSVCDTEVSP